MTLSPNVGDRYQRDQYAEDQGQDGEGDQVMGAGTRQDFLEGGAGFTSARLRDMFGALDEALAETDWPPDMSNEERRQLIAQVLAETEADIAALPWWARWLARLEMRRFRWRNGY